MSKKNIDSLGDFLLKSRKSLNLSKQYIADKLCLKLEIISNIENNLLPDNILPVFFCGYIRSYARLLNIKDKDLDKYLEKNSLCDFYYSKKYKNDKKNLIKEFYYIKIFILLKLLFFLVFSFFLN